MDVQRLVLAPYRRLIFPIRRPSRNETQLRRWSRQSERHRNRLASHAALNTARAIPRALEIQTSFFFMLSIVTSSRIRDDSRNGATPGARPMRTPLRSANERGPISNEQGLSQEKQGDRRRPIALSGSFQAVARNDERKQAHARKEGDRREATGDAHRCYLTSFRTTD